MICLMMLPRESSSLSATNSMYCFIKLAFMPSSAHGSAPVKNSCSMLTASVMTPWTACLLERCLMGEEEAGEVSVEALVMGYELVREGQTSHEATLVEPENRGEGAGEEDTLNGSEGNETLSKGRILVLYPPNCPVGLLLDARNGLNGIEEVCALSLLLDVCVDEEEVCLGVNVLDHDLETVEDSGLLGFGLRC
ncbi:hypothetical protein VC83_08106 [Pseudogymnoascus destructans]|uniref:Uncharacterized protein n=1 Tax=Pseudogymnoascus destructans TaxID=655981 RepID=A0A176ZZH5_9PEZI|nr:uncharacterized protein VC83_08106 [Pseudogymnoascus destructans]OAF55326.1 hypothetical protein VC83_08106 [Pseudogymnoascus destructans]